MLRSTLRTWLTTVAVALALASGLQAQPNKKSIMVPDKAEGGMQTFTGKGKVTDAINADLGAIFDIGGGITMMFPKGLPVGRSRLVTLEKARGRLPTHLIPKFKPVGPTLEFSGSFNTAGKPMVLSIPGKSDPARAGVKLVVAMEVGTFCEKANKAYKLKNGLCSGFELHDAEFDAAGKRLVANLRSTGGLRMQFGTVPDDAGE